MVSVNSRIQRKLFGRLLSDRRGTAEVIGSVMFVLILFYAFTNFYLWHDSATREMNYVLAEKMNSLVSIENVTGGLNVTNNGGFEVRLSRLWLINVSGSTPDHIFVDLEKNSTGSPINVTIAAGAEIQLLFSGTSVRLHDDDDVRSIMADFVDGDIWVYYPVPNHSVRCKILTTLGNMAACTYEP